MADNSKFSKFRQGLDSPETIATTNGREFDAVALDAIALSVEQNREVSFFFGDQVFAVTPVTTFDELYDSLDGDLTRNFSQRLNSSDLTAARALKNSQMRSLIENEKFQFSDEKKWNMFSTEDPKQALDMPDMTESDIAYIKKRRNRVAKLAEDWAKVMQVKMASTLTVAEIAQESYDVADIFQATPSGVEQTVELLSETWVHGTALLTWYNQTIDPNVVSDRVVLSRSLLLL